MPSGDVCLGGSCCVASTWVTMMFAGSLSAALARSMGLGQFCLGA